MSDRTFIGLDVHARSTVGYALDPESGQVWQRRMGADPGEVVGWVRSLPGPVKAGYEAGPTGYGLARLLLAAGVPTEVLAPSKIVRPAGDRVKTDVRDAQLLAQVLAMGEYAAVRIPSQAEESARDLWRLRVAIAGDARRAKQRIGHLLLRRGLVYDGSPWTQAHLRWLRGVGFDDPTDARVYDTSRACQVFCVSQVPLFS